MKKIFAMMLSFMALASCGQQAGKAPALDLSNLDTTVSPKEDFYKYATGGWQVKNPLRPEFSRFGSFDVIAENNQKQLNELFESMVDLKAKKGTVEQKISDLYKMALDSTTRNAWVQSPSSHTLQRYRLYLPKRSWLSCWARCIW